MALKKFDTFPSTQEAPILYTAPEDLPVIEELKDFMKSNGFKNLKDMLEFSGEDLLKMDGFGYRCLVDYMNLLEKHECLGWFQEDSKLT